MIDDITGEEIDDQELYGEEDEISVSKDLEEHELVSHYEINQSLSGTLEELEDGYARVLFTATQDMVVDRRGMIHSGFIFGAANYAAMAAVNISTAILAVSKTNFLAPLSVNDEAVFEATAQQKDTRKRNVMVVGYFNNIKFFEGEFTIVVLEHHPLSIKLS